MRTRPKVLQVNKLYSPWIGGVERVVQDVAESLQHAVDTEVLVCQPRGLGRKDVVNGVTIHRVSSLGILFSMPIAPRFPFALRRLSAGSDIIHFHSPFPLGELSYLWGANGRRMIVTWYSDIVRQRISLRLYRPFLRRFLLHADRVVVISERMLASSELPSTVRSRCVVIPPGIDLSKYEASPEHLRQARNIRNYFGSPLILFVGRLVYYKGIEYLIEAMRHVPAVLIIVGEGPKLSELKRISSSFGLNSRVHFIGSVAEQDLIALYHACDVFVLPSTHRSEAFGIVQLEGMACGKPVINTALPTGVPGVSLHGETGITVPPRNADALAEAIVKLLEDPARRLEFGANARRRVEKEFSLQVVAHRMLELYREVSHG